MERYTIFKEEDHSSPIFINDNKYIGYIYIFRNNINNYNNDLFNNKKLIGFIRLFFYYIERIIKDYKIKNGKYHLINNQLIKQLKEEYKYENLENKLNKIYEVKQIINSIKEENKEYINELTYKKLYLILKKLPKNIIKKNKKNKNNINDFMLEELQLKVINNTNIFYYDDFKLINDDIYNLLINNVKKDYLDKYYININSAKKYLYFTIPEIINKSNEHKYTLEVGFLKDFIFNPSHILIYNSKEVYEQFLDNLNKKIDFDSFLDNYNFDNNNLGKLFDEQNNVFGFIYNLNEKAINISINNIGETLKVLNHNKIINNSTNEKVVINNNNAFISNIRNNLKQSNNYINIQNSALNIPPQNAKILSPEPKINNILNIKKEFFSTPMLIGLQFIGGAPIYMNAFLQCFCQIEEIVNYFKYKPSVINCIQKYQKENKINLTKAFKLLIDNLWPSQLNGNNNKLLQNNNNYYFAPYDIKDTIYK